MFKFALLFIAGILAFKFILFFPFTITGLFFTAGVFFVYRQNKKAATCNSLPINGYISIALAALVFAAGSLYSFIRHADLSELVFPKHAVTIEGTVTGGASVSKGKITFDLDSNIMDGSEIKGRVRLILMREKFQPGSQEYFVLPGNRVRVIAKLKSPHMLRNPGVYAYDMKKEGIAASGYVRSMQLIDYGSGVFNYVQKRRQDLGRIIDMSLSEESASLHKAIIAGFKGDVDQEMRDAFSATGLAHLLSISGTHFGLLAVIIFQVARAVFKRIPLTTLQRATLFITPSQLAVIVTIPVMVLYLFISGSSTPAVRSFIMVLIYMCALLLGRKGQWLNSLSVAAVIILLLDPDTLFDIAFILSFLAVLSIGLVLEKRQEVLQNTEQRTQNTDNRLLIGGIIEKAKTAPLMTGAAVLGTAPVVALVFKQFPVISPLTNILVTPLVCFIILPLGFFSGFCALIFNMDTMPLSGLTDAVTGLAQQLIGAFAGIAYSHVHIHNPPFVLVVLYYLSLVFVVRWRVRFIFRIIPFLIVICIYLSVPYLPDNNFRVTFLDVGQGEAAVVDLPDGKVMLVDGSTGRPDMGRRVVAPYLWARGTNRIDYVVLSHPHPDHYGGLVYILNNFEIGEIWMSGRMVSGTEVFFEMINAKEIKHKILARGHTLETELYRISVLHPYDTFFSYSSNGEHSDQNNDCLVLKIEADDMSVLFTGDIERESEENLLYIGKWLDSDVLKVPHHGSRTSSTQNFINAVSPRIAVVSAGRNNPFRHPHEEVLYRYHRDEVRLFRTDTHGAVVIEARKDSLGVTTAGDRVLREVSGWRDELHNLRVLLL